MPCIVIIKVKKSPKIPQFAAEASQIMNMKGFRLISNNNSDPTYFNPGASIQPATVTSLIKMIKAIQTYPQVVKNIIFSSTFRNG